MVIIKASKYNRSYKKLLSKNMTKELIRIDNIENLIINANNLKELLSSPYKDIYHIEKKKGDLKEFYTARVNSKLRLIMKPVGNYPYNVLEIVEIEFLEIDFNHYGEG